MELEQGDQGAEQEEEDVNVEVEEEVMDDHVERIFVPEHKNQATSPGHPMAQCEVEEEYAVVVNAAASDVEVTIFAIINGNYLLYGGTDESPSFISLSIYLYTVQYPL